MDKAREWLLEYGAVMINRAVTKFSGKKIGPVPIENLEIDIPADVSMKALAERITNKNCVCVYRQYADGAETILIYM